MSRGLGKIQRIVIEILTPPKSWAFGTDFILGTAIVRAVAEQLGVVQTPALEASVRRALALLQAKGVLLRKGKGWVKNEPRYEHAKERTQRTRRRKTEERANLRRTPAQNSETRVLVKLLGML
jgi:hypothetical protein